MKKYRPSNGTEGELFISKWCNHCIKETATKACSILTDTMLFGVDEPGYPKQWVYGEDGKPGCTAFQEKGKIINAK